MQALFGAFSGPSTSLDVVLTNVDGRLNTRVEGDAAAAGGAGAVAAAPAGMYVYSNGENVEGEARIVVPAGKKLEHVGIRAELKGVVELFGDKSGGHEFLQAVRELSVPGILPPGTHVLKFAFPRVDMPYESYEGINARCRYYVRVTVSRSGYTAANMAKDVEFAVRNVEPPPAADSSVKLEVGIEDCLHIEFEYDRTRYHLGDVVTGRVNFLLVKIRIKYMELAVIRREAAGQAPQIAHESETLTRFEVMDGCPVRGERIPLRLYLSGLSDLSPSYPNVANSFSVRYFLNLVLVDEEDRRYFKQQEITLWRKDLAPPKMFP